MGDSQYPWKAIDGTNQTGWSSSWDIPAWLMIEFDDVYTIGSVGIWWGSHKHNYSISLSTDGANWTTVVGPGTSMNEEAGPIIHELFSITPMAAKYIRIDITSTSAPGSHIFQASVNEIEAYVVSASEPETEPEPDDEADETDETNETDEASDTFCSTFGLPLIAGLVIVGLMLVKVEE